VDAQLAEAVDMAWLDLARLRDILDTKVKWTVAGLALVTVVVLGVLMVHRAAFSTKLNSDFTTYRAAGLAVLNGHNIYKVQNSRRWPYVYPPPFAILMTPFAMMSAFTASIIWYALSVILVVSSVQMCVTMVCARERFSAPPFWLYVLSFAAVLLWVGQGLVEGQATLLTLWLLIFALYRSQHDGNISGGAALASAALLKAFPLAFLAYFIAKQQWRFVTAALTALIVGGIALPALVFGWQRNLTYWQEWGATVARPALGVEPTHPQSENNDRVFSPDNPRNQALRAVLWRLGAKSQARPLAAAVGLTMAAALFVIARLRRDQQNLVIAAAWLAWIILVVPVSHFHYQALALLPMSILAHLALIKPATLLVILARTALIVYLAASVCTLASTHLQYIGLLCWTTLGLWAILLFIAAQDGGEPKTLATAGSPTCT
jgi:Glycosyltransferase family 87